MLIFTLVDCVKFEIGANYKQRSVAAPSVIATCHPRCVFVDHQDDVDPVHSVAIPALWHCFQLVSASAQAHLANSNSGVDWMNVFVLFQRR